MSLVSEISEVIMWLNNNSGAIQAITTFILVIVTSIYVKLTKEMVDELKKENKSRKIQDLVNCVINPIKNSAKSNLEKLEKGQYHYHHKTGEIFISKLEPSHSRSTADLDTLNRAFEEDYSEISEKIKKYNVLRDELEKAVDDLANSILTSPEFKERFFQMVDEYNKNVPDKKLTYTNLERYFESLIGEIIDKTEKLSDRDNSAQFWEIYKEQLFGFLESEKIKEKTQKVEDIRFQLIDILRIVIRKLERVEYRLWREYNIRIERREAV